MTAERTGRHEVLLRVTIITLKKNCMEILDKTKLVEIFFSTTKLNEKKPFPKVWEYKLDMQRFRVVYRRIINNYSMSARWI